MARTIHTFNIEELPGETIPDLHTAQCGALPLISANMQSVIRDLLTRGDLVNVNGKIIPRPKG
jgi:hypothetical protein